MNKRRVTIPTIFGKVTPTTILITKIMQSFEMCKSSWENLSIYLQISVISHFLTFCNVRVEAIPSKKRVHPHRCERTPKNHRCYEKTISQSEYLRLVDTSCQVCLLQEGSSRPLIGCHRLLVVPELVRHPRRGYKD